MAAQGETINLPEGVWVLISATGVDVSAASWSVKGHSTVTVKAMASEVAPTDFKGSHDYAPGQGEKNATLADLWPDITPVRIYAQAQTGNSSITCNHAA